MFVRGLGEEKANQNHQLQKEPQEVRVGCQGPALGPAVRALPGSHPGSRGAAGVPVSWSRCG